MFFFKLLTFMIALKCIRALWISIHSVINSRSEQPTFSDFWTSTQIANVFSMPVLILMAICCMKGSVSRGLSLAIKVFLALDLLGVLAVVVIDTVLFALGPNFLSPASDIVDYQYWLINRYIFSASAAFIRVICFIVASRAQESTSHSCRRRQR